MILTDSSPHDQKHSLSSLLQKTLLILTLSVSNCDEKRNAIKLLNLFSTGLMQISLPSFPFFSVCLFYKLFVLLNLWSVSQQKLITEKAVLNWRRGYALKGHLLVCCLIHTVHKYFKPYLSPRFSPPPMPPKDKKYSSRKVLILVFLFLKSHCQTRQQL